MKKLPENGLKAAAMKVNKTAGVDKAIDAPGQQWVMGEAEHSTGRIHAQALTLLAQLDGIPDRADPFNPLSWDDQGFPT